MDAPFKMKNSSIAKFAKVAGSPVKHKPWAGAHKERPAHSATAEAHNAKPAETNIKKFKDGKDGAVSRGNSASNVSR